MSATFKTLSSSKSWEWPTPRSFYIQLDEEFHFDFDPCPLAGDNDGTSQLFTQWSGKRVFCNPPYGKGIRKFLERWHEAEVAVYLVPARTDTLWFHEIALPFAKEIRFIKGRLRNEGINKNPWPFPVVVIVFMHDVTMPIEEKDAKPEA